MAGIMETTPCRPGKECREGRTSESHETSNTKDVEASQRRAIGSSGFVRGNQVLSGSNQMRRQNDPDIVHTELVLMGFNYLRLS